MFVFSGASRLRGRLERVVGLLEHLQHRLPASATDDVARGGERGNSVRRLLATSSRRSARVLHRATVRVGTLQLQQQLQLNLQYV